jgi:hypothetical protein
LAVLDLAATDDELVGVIAAALTLTGRASER